MNEDYRKKRREAWFAYKKANKDTGKTFSVVSFCAGYDIAWDTSRTALYEQDVKPSPHQAWCNVNNACNCGVGDEE
jgi:hypothetical protein